jgi:hypothetical protein
MSKCKLVWRQYVSKRLNFTETKNFNNDLGGLGMLQKNKTIPNQAP